LATETLIKGQYPDEGEAKVSLGIRDHLSYFANILFFFGGCCFTGLAIRDRQHTAEMRRERELSFYSQMVKVGEKLVVEKGEKEGGGEENLAKEVKEDGAIEKDGSTSGKQDGEVSRKVPGTANVANPKAAAPVSLPKATPTTASNIASNAPNTSPIHNNAPSPKLSTPPAQEEEPAITIGWSSSSSVSSTSSDEVTRAVTNPPKKAMLVLRSLNALTKSPLGSPLKNALAKSAVAKHRGPPAKKLTEPSSSSSSDSDEGPGPGSPIPIPPKKAAPKPLPKKPGIAPAIPPKSGALSSSSSDDSTD
jgi:hypothetical protein